MNKKLFVLLPAVLLLAACGGNTTSTTSGSTGGTETTDTGSTGSTTGTTTTSEEEPSIYGTAEAPITVAEYLAVVGTVTEAVNGTYSPEPFYIKGIADSNSALGSTWANIFLKDALTDTKSCKVQKALNGTGVTATEIGKNDTIVVKGYGEYYNGSYALYGGADGYENPSILSITRGTSTVTASGDEHVRITNTVPTSATNGTVINCTIALDEGYKVSSFKVNGKAVDPVEGVYPATVMGDTTIAVTSELDLVENDLPAGTYTVVINYQNTGLGEAEGNANTNLVIKEPVGDVGYKKLSAVFTKCLNQTSYGEFAVNKGGSIVITTPTGKITKIVADYYNYVNCDVYAGSTEGASVTPTELPATSNNKSKCREYAIDNAVAIFDNASNYSNSLFDITITIVVD